MKAKYIILSVLAAFSAFLFGCTQDPITGSDLDNLKVDNSYVQILPGGGSTTFYLTANEAWKLYVRTAYDYKYKDSNGKDKTATVDTLIIPGTTCKPRGITTPVESWITASPVEGTAGEHAITVTGPASETYRTQDIRIVGKSGTIIVTVAQGEDVTKEYKASEAIKLIRDGKQTGSPVIVKGIVCKIDEISTSYGNATYYLSDDGTFTGDKSDGNWLEVYRGYWMNGDKFTKGDEIAVGDELTIKAVLIDYQGTPETNSGTAEVISIKKSLVAVSPSAIGELPSRDTVVKVAALYSGDNLNYAIDEAGLAFLSIVGTEQKEDTTFVSIHVAENTSPVSRSGIVSLSSTKGKDKSLATVTVTQAGAAKIVTITEALALDDNTAVLVKEALVSAKTTVGFVATDGTSAIYVYDNAENTVAIGDKVGFAAAKSSYSGVPQLSGVSNLKVASSGNAISRPVPVILNDVGFDTYTSSTATYVTFYGTLSLTFNNTDNSIKYANITVDGVTGFQGSLTKPGADLNLADLNGKVVTVTGYYNGISGTSTKYQNVIAVSVEEGVKVPVTYKYKKVSAVTSGKKYLIASVVDGTAKVMNTLAQSGITKTYGYLKATDAEIESDVITLGDDTHEFTFTASGEGFTVQNSESKYIYQNGTYKTYNENASSNENCVWSVSAAEGVFTITSPSGYSMYFDTEFSSYGAYNEAKETYVKPCLFERQ